MEKNFVIEHLTASMVRFEDEEAGFSNTKSIKKITPATDDRQQQTIP